jgi:predicted glycosyltransferase
VPLPSGEEREAALTTDYNSEMIEHVERHPGVRDRAIFVGDPEDIAPLSFGEGLPAMRDWVPKHFDFAGYIIGQHPQTFGKREELRDRLGYRSDERVCIVTVGGSAVGAHLIRRILQSYASIKKRLPELRMVVVAGPRNRAFSCTDRSSLSRWLGCCGVLLERETPPSMVDRTGRHNRARTRRGPSPG